MQFRFGGQVSTFRELVKCAQALFN
uniref:Transposase n=1 Tax=Ralstonia solanacearum TaxID=305 RepID=A0A0S4UGC7_RALSL|nr:protein of unknown function [Ralstonia solanacearum]CUV31696.1 protein of unknown function [Ralstonia solanacearum]